VKDEHDDDAPISVSLHTLARHILETPRSEVAALRAAFDRQISSIEARMDASRHQPAIDATVKIIAEAIGEHVDHAQQQLESTQANLAAVEADRKAIAAQLRDTLNENKKLAAALDKSQTQRADLQAQLKNSQQRTEELVATITQYQHLAAASQKLTDGLSRTTHAQPEQPRPIAAAPPIRSESAEDKPAAKIPRLSAAPPKSAPKKPLQFSGPARDVKRVTIRRGTHVHVDGIPGELVDLSIGGAQAVVRQMVKPNQLVRLILPTAAGQLICKGRIVWVLYEQPGTSLSVYRFGVKFTDVEVRTVEDFMQDFGEEPLASSQPSSGIA
jgi:hypothetical protein